MKLIYKCRWFILGISIYAWAFAFGAFFAGGVSAILNQAILTINLIFIPIQVLNIITAYKKLDMSVFFILLFGLVFILIGICALYIFNWDYAVRALTVGI